MNLISEHNFSVSPGEEVFIRVTPRALQTNLVVVTLDGTLLQPSGGDPAANYSFSVTNPAGAAHMCVIEATFDPGWPADSSYEVQVEAAGYVFEKFSLRANEYIRVVNLSFQVEGSSQAEEVKEDPWSDPPIIVQHSPPEPWD